MRTGTTTFIAILLLAGMAHAATILVPSQYPTIQAGINAAVDGDTVLVADGTYTGTGNKNIDFLGKAIVVMSENGAESCIIDCQNDGRGFYFHSDEDSNSVLLGFKVMHGWQMDTGGGILSENSSPLIKNCTISYNRAQGPSGCSGGGISCFNSNAIILNCAIRGNSVFTTYDIGFAGGGGIYCYQSNPIISQCTVTENSCFGEKYSYGAGIYCWYSNATISNCSISQNSATGYANLQGGGIYCGHSSPVISHCSIGANRVQPDGHGGGISCEYSTPIIEYCTIYENYAEPGGGGGIDCGWSSDPILRNVTISRNRVAAGGGGGIMCGAYSNSRIENVIVEGNYGDCGVYFSYNFTAEFSYSDFYNNEGGNFLGNVPPGLGEIITINANGDSCDAFYNIFEDPLFEDPASGNFQITWANYPMPDSTKSPCIDAGDPTSPLDPDGTIVDMGALYFNQILGLTIILTPYNPPIIIPPGGGAFAYNIEVANNGNVPETFDVWVNIEVPGGFQFPILGPLNDITLAPGSSIERDRTVFVPGSAPAGEYRCVGMIGDYPWNVMESDEFPFVKEGGDGLWQGSEGWILTGEPFPGEALETAEVHPSSLILHPSSFIPAPPTPSTPPQLSAINFRQIATSALKSSTFPAAWWRRWWMSGEMRVCMR